MKKLFLILSFVVFAGISSIGLSYDHHGDHNGYHDSYRRYDYRQYHHGYRLPPVIIIQPRRYSPPHCWGVRRPGWYDAYGWYHPPYTVRRCR